MDGFLDFYQNEDYSLSLFLISLIVRRVLMKKATDFAFNLLLLQTKFRIVELKNEENIPEDKAYINITINEMSCHSLVGKVGFIQPLEIGDCSAREAEEQNDKNEEQNNLV